eukprot:TRINITY_DN5887_c0_g1_i1.p1 TRINITY_DN5887_c0_g1~~TRINITY_DN5887_c0_g1_i1.p1  ORF type:complete len:275 (+),score=73.61 TRINITY_DN5887_c0_g1_i1:76-900(+)
MADIEEQLECALDLMRRMPPAQIQDNLSGLIDLCPDLTESLLGSVDQPLAVEKDTVSNREFLLCDYNRDGDSYRSPWTNRYFPHIDGGATPSDKLRKLEIVANDMFSSYMTQYYDDGLSSAYFWDLDGGFACCILFKKIGDQARKASVKGSWDSIHVMEVRPSNKRATYKLTTTVMLNMATATVAAGHVGLSGSLTRQETRDLPVEGFDTHLVNMGHMVEDMESRLRNTLEEVYFSKTKNIVDDIRVSSGLAEQRRRKELQMGLQRNMKERSGN